MASFSSSFSNFSSVDHSLLEQSPPFHFLFFCPTVASTSPSPSTGDGVGVTSGEAGGETSGEAGGEFESPSGAVYKNLAAGAGVTSDSVSGSASGAALASSHSLLYIAVSSSSAKSLAC